MEDSRYVEMNIQGENKHNNEEELQPLLLFGIIWLQINIYFFVGYQILC